MVVLYGRRAPNSQNGQWRLASVVYTDWNGATAVGDAAEEALLRGLMARAGHGGTAVHPGA
jgi:hypothetical protein